MLNLRSFTLIAIFSVAVLATSCNKADDGYIPSESEMMLKKGKPTDKPGAPAKGDKTIAQIVVDATEADAPQFTLLLGALEYAGLTNVFAGGDQYTVFAPTDEAFVNLVVALGVADADNPFMAIDELLGEGTVANVLLYHVTEGRRATNSVVPNNGERIIETLLTPINGATFSVFTEGEEVFIDAIGNEAQIIGTDISASNGIIHVIDTVILPIGGE